MIARISRPGRSARRVDEQRRSCACRPVVSRDDSRAHLRRGTSARRTSGYREIMSENPPDFAMQRAVEILANIYERAHKQQDTPPPPADKPILIFSERIALDVTTTTKADVDRALGIGFMYPTRGWHTYGVRGTNNTRLLLSIFYSKGADRFGRALSAQGRPCAEARTSGRALPSRAGRNRNRHAGHVVAGTLRPHDGHADKARPLRGDVRGALSWRRSLRDGQRRHHRTPSDIYVTRKLDIDIHHIIKWRNAIWMEALEVVVIHVHVGDGIEHDFGKVFG